MNYYYLAYKQNRRPTFKKLAIFLPYLSCFISKVNNKKTVAGPIPCPAVGRGRVDHGLIYNKDILEKKKEF